MATVGQTTLATLFSPLDITGVLVGDETVYYAERQHWASMAQPLYQTFLIVVLITWLAGAVGGGDPVIQRMLLIVLIVGGIQAALMALNGNNPVSRLAIDPFSSARKGPNRVARWGAVAVLVYLVYSLGLAGAGIAVVLGLVIRMASILARWSFYERRYITSKRLIESGGFFGSRINSMPLTRVTDFSFNRTLAGELVGYASMRIETAGQDQALGTVRYITDPRQFYDVLVALSVPPAPGVPPPAFND